MKRCSLLLVVLGAAALAAAAPPAPAPPDSAAVDSAGWRLARPDYRWSFPRDHWAHPGFRTEWWYFTGHLEGAAPPRRFAYQITLFRVGLVREPAPGGAGWRTRNLVMGHFAIADLDRGERRFSELLYREAPLLAHFGAGPGEPIVSTRGPAGTDALWTLAWTGDGFRAAAADSARGMTLDLTLAPQRPLVLEGPNGYSVKARAAGAASEYYSFPRLASAGTLRFGGRTWSVRGASWMDREFSSSRLAPGQVGWDWFSLNLADGRDLMLYVLRRADGRVDHRSGTLVSARGTARTLHDAEWRVRALATWKSPASGAAYPSRWLVELPGEGIRVEVRPELAAQENLSALLPQIRYWEGAVEVRAAGARPGAPAIGRGFVELTGYARGGRPPL